MPRDPKEELIRRLFELQALSNTLSDKSDAILRLMFDDIVAALARIDPTGVQPRYRQGRLDKLSARVREIAGPAYAQLFREQRAALATIGAREAQRVTDSLKVVLGAGSAGKVAPTTGLGTNFFKAVIDTEPIQGALLKDWFTDQSRKTVFKVDRQIKLGVLQGETIDQMVRRVRGRSAGRRGQYVGGVMQTSTRDAAAIVRTAVNDISNVAGMNCYKNNADVLSGVRYTATLDSRTSAECMALDGSFWKLDDPGIKRPPRHVNCRSVLVPEVDWKGLGMEPPPEGTRASADGQVPSSTTYGEWLKSQPASLQDEILGSRARGKLFRDGRASLKDLVTSDGRRVPLDQLAEAA